MKSQILITQPNLQIRCKQYFGNSIKKNFKNEIVTLKICIKKRTNN